MLFSSRVKLALVLIGGFFLISVAVWYVGSTDDLNKLLNSDLFGVSVTNIGDLDGDGVTDIAVGAIKDDAGGYDKGALHIIFLNPDGTPKSTVEINDLTENGPELANGDSFGSSVTSLGDLDGDGTVDIAVGAIKDDASNYDEGALHIIFLNPDGTPKSTVEIDKWTLNGIELGKNLYFGYSVANLGDMDGDGTVDIAVGSVWDSVGGAGNGAIRIIFLNPDGSPRRISIASNGLAEYVVRINDATPNGPDLSRFSWFGASVANIGDLDGDGVTDIAVGAIGDADGSGKGVIHIIFLNSDGTPKSTVEINYMTENGPDILYADNFGDSVANIGDLDGDGVTDIAVGAVRDDTGGAGKGALHIIFLNSDGTPKSTVEINDLTENGPELANGDSFGSSVTSLGDLDGDGVTDIAVGAHNDMDDTKDDVYVNGGALHIIFLNSDGTPKLTVEINDSTTHGPDLLDDDFLHLLSRIGVTWMTEAYRIITDRIMTFCAPYGEYWYPGNLLTTYLNSYGVLEFPVQWGCEKYMEQGLTGYQVIRVHNEFPIDLQNYI